MKIVLLGSGNVAWHIGKTLFADGHEVLQVYSRNIEHADSLANAINAKSINNTKEISYDADFYICMLKDDILNMFLLTVPKTDKIWLHTSGAVGMDIFEGKIDNYGVLYPLQSFTKSRELNFSQIPLFIEGSNEDVLYKIETLAKSISDKVFYLNSEKRKKLHLAAVFANNFTNYLYDISSQILAGENIPFDVLYPLIQETVDKIVTIAPKLAQTGPAKRGDLQTMQSHLDLLNDSFHKEIYKLLSEGINKRHEI